ncbi:4'-phosphopantetheinyl transferase superfamily protein [Flavobacterium fluvii]|uniref:4'-phosphopantetheinyl transferase superfamily protein n=1 Tax=Flavobacterium fluvii TaxID=468056 RepID=A0A1M5MIE9_9FLAO|nr:4'-phosphopantetheinyl transferase superfamily protein [Flavobacterium fluvii]SHG77110.1 4'-phosphopantetheinyl transferase superfamily protein [Flavobacterium fluvii]
MIGNDIVDLALAQKESNWKRKGFLDKIFTKNEQFQILNAQNPEIMVWNLWSRKEAAYKIYNRQTQIRGYFPLQLECFDLEIIDGITFGKVVIKEDIYFTKTAITPQFIHTIAVEDVLDFVKITTLENQKNILKNNGIPNYFEKESSVPRPTSISHHGRFEQIVMI